MTKRSERAIFGALVGLITTLTIMLLDRLGISTEALFILLLLTSLVAVLVGAD